MDPPPAWMLRLELIAQVAPDTITTSIGFTTRAAALTRRQVRRSRRERSSD
jgi:hypothetical protein